MSDTRLLRFFSFLLAVTLLMTAAACSPGASLVQSTAAPTASPAPVAVSTPLPEPTQEPSSTAEEPTPTSLASTPTIVAIVDKSVLYQNDFSNPESGWPSEKFDNYFVGYHAPGYYHFDLRSPNDQFLVPVPGKIDFDDVTMEAQVFVDTNNTAADGDFRYGLVFRRSGNQFYAFMVSPHSKKWYLLKSSPTALEVLKEGADESLQGPEVENTLRVDVKGATFYLHINNHLVGQVSDDAYANGETGLFVQTLDIVHVHVHFDAITLRQVDVPQFLTSVVYQDEFSSPGSGWPSQKFDNYFVGYHAPGYFHFDLRSPNDHFLVPVPGKTAYDDVTIDAQVFVDTNNTAAEGDFRYGPVFRRSGNQYYAFVISPRSKKWYLLKSSPTALEVLKEGVEASLQGPEVENTLRVDAQGSTFFLHINNHLVGQVSDNAYANGEAGLFAQTLDITHVHVHFDAITLRQVEVPLVCTVIVERLNVRSGPSMAFNPPTFSVSYGERLEAQGRSSDGQWLRMGVEAGDQQGWVNYSDKLLSCTGSAADLPVIVP